MMLQTWFDQFAARTGIPTDFLAIAGVLGGATILFIGLVMLVSRPDYAAQRIAASSDVKRKARQDKALLIRQSDDVNGLLKAFVPTDRKGRSELQLKLQHFRRLRDDVKKARQEAIASFEAQYPSNVSPSPLADSHVAPALSTEYSAAAQQLRRRQMASSLALARQVDVGRSLVKQAKNAYQLLLKRRNHRKLLLETVRQTSILLCDAATIASSVDGAMSRTGVRAA